jgi:3'-phosphoadenosine 5'-phosphosulfate (PAPS) 3'-phosphatase
MTTTIYNQLQASTDWDYVAGAALAALTGGNTLNITSRHHKLTIVGGTIDNIADAAGAAEG